MSGDKPTSQPDTPAESSAGVSFAHSHRRRFAVHKEIAVETTGSYAICDRSQNVADGTWKVPATLSLNYDRGGSVQEAPSIAMNATGSFVVSWDDVYLEGVTNSPGIYAQRYNAAGAPQGIQIHVNSFVTGAQQYASIAIDTAGDFIVAWESWPISRGTS